MRFRTEVTAASPGWQLHHGSKILCLGSCFATEIGGRLAAAKFDPWINPFGVIFHPVPLLRNLRLFAEGGEAAFWKDFGPSCFERKGIHGSFFLHSSFSHPDFPQFQQAINQLRAAFKSRLEKAEVLILTFGTAIAQHHTALDTVVANNHRFSAQDFESRISKLDELHREFVQFISLLKKRNPNLKILLTVSPVRHSRSGMENNSISKAVLRLFCHQLIEKYPQTSYFPAYEILLDDLRDYRFFKKDLVHPAELAVDYIWGKFSEVFFGPETKALNKKIAQVKKDLNHRPIQAEGEAYQKFLARLEYKIQDLEPGLDMNSEQEILKKLKGD